VTRRLADYDGISDARRGQKNRFGTTAAERIEINLRELAALGVDTAAVRARLNRAPTDKGKVLISSWALALARGIRTSRPLGHEWRCRGISKSSGGRCQRIVEYAIREEGVHYCRFHGGAYAASGIRARRLKRLARTEAAAP